LSASAWGAGDDAAVDIVGVFFGESGLADGAGEDPWALLFAFDTVEFAGRVLALWADSDRGGWCRGLRPLGAVRVVWVTGEHC
jgi:hypothetical protein